jgi:hypothetical protein
MCVSPTCGMQEGLKQVAHCRLVKIVEFTSIFVIVRLPHTPSLSDICCMCQVGEIAYLQLRWVWAPMPIGLDRLLNATFDYRVMGTLEVSSAFCAKAPTPGRLVGGTSTIIWGIIL